MNPRKPFANCDVHPLSLTARGQGEVSILRRIFATGVWLTLAAFISAGEARVASVSDLQKLSVGEKEDLAKKKELFDKLSDSERKRIRELRAQIDAHPESQELLGVMAKYHEWLKTLSANQQAQLRDLPGDKRISRIREIQRDQQRKAWERMTKDAAPEDLETIYSWLGEYVGKHRDASLWSLPPEIRQRLAKMDERRQTHLLMFNVLSRRNPLAPRPKPEEIDALIAKLSPQAQSLLKQSDNAADVFGVLSTWGRSAVFSKAFPVVTKEELATFFEKLPPEERDRLERMTPEDRDNEVKQLYARQSFFGIRPGERLFEPFGPPRKER